MARDGVAAVGSVQEKGPAQATQQTAQSKQAPEQKETASAQKAPANDAFTPSEDLEEEQQADEKKKAEEARKREDELKAEEDKKKELQEKIQARTKELEEAKRNGDQRRVGELTKEIEGLERDLQALENQQPAGGGPAPAQAAGAGNAPPAAPPGGIPQGGGGGAPQGGGGQIPAGAPAGSYPATPPDLGGYHPPNAQPSGPIPEGQIKPDGSGQDSVDLARQYLGRNSADIKGHMPNFTAAGGQTNNCADFVSSALESTGRVKGHHINVQEFETSLQQQGYQRVSKENAQPGDVWISSSKGHTELVADRGANTLIGSNNDRPGHQVISEHRNQAGGYYYHLPERREG